MEKASRMRLIFFAAIGILLAATILSCNQLLQMAQVRFNNQSTDRFTSITLGAISVGLLTAGSETSYQLVDSGTYTLQTVSGAGAIAWPTDVTVNQPGSYAIVFFGTAANLGADFKRE